MINSKQNNIIIFLLLSVLIAPSPGILFGSFSIRLIDLLILILSLVTLVIFLFKNRVPYKNWALIFFNDRIIMIIILFSLSVIISTIVGSIMFPEESGITDVYELYRYAFYFTFYIFFAYFLTDIKKLFKATLITSIIIQVFGILQFFNIFDVNNNIGLLYTKNENLHMMIQVQHRISSTLGNPNVYGSFLLILFSFLLSLLFMKKENTVNFRILLYCCISLTIFSIFLTTSRTTVIVSIILIFYAVIYHLIIRQISVKEIVLKSIFPLITYLVIAFLLVPQIPYLNSAFSSISNTLELLWTEKGDVEKENIENNNTIDNSQDDSFIDPNTIKESLESVNSFRNRYDYWKINLDYFKESPIVGAGPMKSGLSFADNSYLYILARYGLIGFILFAFFIGYVFFSTIAINIKKQENISKLLVSSTLNLIIVGYAVMGVVSEVWFNIESMIIIFSLIGLIRNKSIGWYSS